MITPEQLSNSGSESGHQKALFCWSNQNLDKYPELKWLFAVPNGFYGSAAQKGKMKAEGLRSGVADICLPVKAEWSLYVGLFIEMKVKNGRLSPEQKEFGEFVISQGYKFSIAYSWQEARDTILEYLGRK